MDKQPRDIQELPSLARERVKIGPAPDWIAPSDYNSDFKAVVRGPVTYLLLERQVNAVLRQTYVRVAARLETMQAVQTQSQWRLEFEPQTQSVVLHSITIRRGSTERDHVSSDRLQFLRREAGLDGFVVDGWITLLLLLEDVVPGDVLEWSYTLTDCPRLLPEHVASFFFLPTGTEIGKCLFSIRHADTRDMKWKSFSPHVTPARDRAEGNIRSYWTGENVSLPEPEPFEPPWQLNLPWIQVSDCPDWQTVACGVLQTWKEEGPGDGLKKLADEVRSVGPNLAARAKSAIEKVQDGFRYLSVNLELGGQVPASAETVIRRRYGDCKDVAFLLVRLLREVGVTARPVLVNAGWRRAIAPMLPSPSVFNHVVVEFEIEDQKRWVDATAKCQGGSALTRRVADFGFGLPVDASSSALAPVPAASLPSGAYEIKESFLLDTFGNPSFLGVNTVAKGIHAEELRFEFENEGIETVAKKRLQYYADRFAKAARIGEIRFRDDREQNEFEIAEAFEIQGFLRPDDVPDYCLFGIQSDLTAGMLFLPSPMARRSSMVLPFPCDRVHTIEVDFNGLQEISLPACNVGNKFFSFSRRCKSAHKYLKVTFSFSTLADCIPSEQLQEHRKRVEEAWQASMFQVRLAVGFGRMRMRSSFGQLSTPPRTATGFARALPPAAAPKPTPPTPPAKAARQTPAGGPTSSPRPALCPEVPASGEPTRGTLPQPSLPKSQGETPPGRSPYRGHRINRRCAWSLWLLVSAFGLFALVGLFASMPGAEGLVAMLGMLMTFVVISALALAGIGLWQCLKSPERYPRGQVQATCTLCFGSLFLCVLIAAVLFPVRPDSARSQGQNQTHPSNTERLKFDTLNFDYMSPPPPWQQVDARAMGPFAVLGFTRPEPMFFAVSASKLESALPNARSQVVEKFKSDLLADASSYHLLSEGEMWHGGLAGWQIECRASFQGHEYHIVQWLLATNGFGYQLAVWGPPSLSAEIKQEADGLFRDFLPATGEVQLGR